MGPLWDPPPSCISTRSWPPASSMLLRLATSSCCCVCVESANNMMLRPAASNCCCARVRPASRLASLLFMATGPGPQDPLNPILSPYFRPNETCFYCFISLECNSVFKVKDCDILPLFKHKCSCTKSEPLVSP